MTAPRSEPIAGTFVVCRVGDHRFAVDATSVDEVVAARDSDADLATEAEELLGVSSAAGERMWLHLSRGPTRAVLSVPRAAIEIGRRLRGRCQAPSLIAAMLERRCLKGVVIDRDQLIYLLDLGRLWERLQGSPRKEQTP